MTDPKVTAPALHVNVGTSRLHHATARTRLAAAADGVGFSSAPGFIGCNAPVVDISYEPQFVSISGIEVFVARGRPPIWDSYCAHAQLVDEDTVADAEAAVLVAGVRTAEREWPGLVLALSYAPSQGGFAPGVLVVPESQVAFVGAGTTLRAYGIGPEVKEWWRDEAELGFWSWRQHGSTVVMSAEVELAAWDTDGTKLWTRFVEPPWSYSVSGQEVTLDVMGTVRTFDLRSGA
ncbi:hypothetical protein KV100_18370 [Mumia sp. zg.B21]|uniref:hypothetical protein n=1 Tax=Mumia sp. zg.B21 TaxID=2855447 RepID=UPI001C6E1DDB|nr:hypothetical protein [Mumia sp. zg.B21]MBW9211622.1 hypothetical protein [Mumia sp. zg.B21]